MLHQQHGDKGEHHEGRAEGEEGIAHSAEIVQHAGKNGGYDLCGHGSGVVIAGVFAHVTLACQLHHHGEGVDVDGGPADTCQGENGVHDRRGGFGRNQRTSCEGRRQHEDACQNGLFSSQFGGDDTHGDIGNDGRRLGHDEGEVVVKAQFVGRIDRVFAGDGVVADEPQGYRGQEQQQGGQLTLGQLVLLCGDVGGDRLLQTVFGSVLFHFCRPLLFLDGEKEQHEAQQHDGANCQHVAGVGHIFILGGGEHHAQNQNQNTACGTRQVDHGVGLGAQRLHGDVGHQGNGGGAEGGHGDQHHQKGGDKAHQGPDVGEGQFPSQLLQGFCRLPTGEVAEENLCQLVVINEGKAYKGDHCGNGTEENIGGTLAEAGSCFVGKCAEDGEHKHRQHVVQGHDCAGGGLGHTEMVGQDQRNDGIVGLPEGRDEEERHAHQHHAFVVEFHGKLTPLPLFCP